MGAGAGAGSRHAGIDRLTRTERGKSARDRQDWCYAVADKGGLIEERKVVSELQRIARADLLIAEEPSVTGADHRVLENTPGQSDAWGEVVLVGIHQAPGCTVLPGHHQLPGSEIEVTLLIVRLEDGAGVIVTKAQVQRKRGGDFIVVLNEPSIRVLAVSEVRQSRDRGAGRKTHQHVCQRVTAAVSRIGRIGRELAGERKGAARLADLEQIELAPAKLRSHFERVLSVHDAERVAVLEFLARAGRRCIAWLA